MTAKGWYWTQRPCANCC